MAPSERLDKVMSELGRRVAALLQRTSPPLADAIELLQSLLKTAQRSEPSIDSPTALAQPWPPEANSPLDRLIAAFNLSPVEVDLLALAGMPEEHEGYASVLRMLHPRSEPRPTVGFAAQLLCPHPAERRRLRQVLSTGPLVRSGALRLVGDAPFPERNLLLADALWPALLGLGEWPAGLHPLPKSSQVHGLEDWLQSPIVATARAALERGIACTMLFSGRGEEVALGRALALVQAAGREPLALSLPSGTPPDLARVISLHCIVRGGIPILLLPPSDETRPGELRGFEDFPGPLLICARAAGVIIRGTRPVLPLATEAPSPLALQRMWRELLPEIPEQDTALLAVRFNLEPSIAAEVSEDVRLLRDLTGGDVTTKDITRSLRTRSASMLPTGVQLRTPTARWEHLVLPEEKLTQLREALGRLMNQPTVLDKWRFLEGRPGARGVRMLFSGPPGTGKTLSAEVMAHALGLDLMVVDVSRLVSKWLGETEKNLSAVFDAAETGQAALLFDEADALFGKRTEVSDAHDRYANLETAYLLARLEQFAGIAILSTNLKDNIDSAFIRRLEFAIEFDDPGQAERERMWRNHIPPGAPVSADVNFEQLAAHYPITGGLIRNAAVAAAFLAAEERTPITQAHFVRAIRREYDKSGRLLPGREFPR